MVSKEQLEEVLGDFDYAEETDAIWDKFDLTVQPHEFENKEQRFLAIVIEKIQEAHKNHLKDEALWALKKVFED